MALITPASDAEIRREPTGDLTLIDGARMITIGRAVQALEGTTVVAWFALLPLPPGVKIVAKIG